ncbi:uncharacterized protein TNIN_31841 [Trichonephila inaurata madagascariensis]|uniref:Uncharacterized protein n=1 Tax=Trichonephila inaurata madagascariensis TaxID=2747483 RepID=A0A8X6IL79_9ARAC|nr:uncharacterized protein TNIN_31841 [Trichonephila inaurata madagascariensis]
METDKEAETFSEALFTYLWFTENFVSASTAASIVGDMAEFIAEVAKAVVVLSALTVPTFNESMQDYFQRNDMSRRSVFTFLVNYCFNNHAETNDIFCVILNTCTFVFRLFIFCQRRGHSEYVELAAMCWTEIFESDLKNDFYANGGWEQFHNYVVSSCYVPNDTDTDHKAFVTFLDEINYLFPKLKVSESQQEYVIKLSASSEMNRCQYHGLSLMDSIVEAAVLLEPLKFIPAVEKNGVFIISDDSADENDDEESDLEERFRQLNPTSEESSEQEFEEDSDEELFLELVKESLDSIKKFDQAPLSADCVVCQNNGDIRKISCKEEVCLKHNPGSFYYLVTRSDA